MKLSILAAAVAVSVLATSAIAAPQEPAVDGSVQIQGKTHYKVAANEFDDYDYAYQLENGQILKFSQRVTSFYTQIRGEPKEQIFARAPGVFMTAAGTRIEFRDAGESVAITNLERLPMAVQMPATGRVMTASR